VNPADITEAFYVQAMSRISRFMMLVAIAATLGAGLRWGWRVAIGLACGCAIAYLNFIWLERVVSALGERAVKAERPQSGRGVAARFLLRYILMAFGAYGILRVSQGSALGLLVGLLLPTAGIVCEAVYQTAAHWSGKSRA